MNYHRGGGTSLKISVWLGPTPLKMPIFAWPECVQAFPGGSHLTKKNPFQRLLGHIIPVPFLLGGVWGWGNRFSSHSKFQSWFHLNTSIKIVSCAMFHKGKAPSSGALSVRSARCLTHPPPPSCAQTPNGWPNPSLVNAGQQQKTSGPMQKLMKKQDEHGAHTHLRVSGRRSCKTKQQDSALQRLVRLFSIGGGRVLKDRPVSCPTIRTFPVHKRWTSSSCFEFEYFFVIIFPFLVRRTRCITNLYVSLQQI